jgi:hypothetical protein
MICRYQLLGPNENAVLWLTPHAAVAPEGEKGLKYYRPMDGQPCRFCFSADGQVMHAFALSSEHLLGICDVIIRLLATSVLHSVRLGKWDYYGSALINVTSLAYLGIFDAG